MKGAFLEPSELAAELERETTLAAGPGDRFLGYAVMGLAFRGGDVLALRRFPVSSAGPGYTSVWHRSAEGRWTFYTDVHHHGCTQYWGSVVDDTVVAPIRIEWTTPRTMTVSVDGGRIICWSLTLDHTPATSLLNLLASWIPDAWWRRPWLLTTIAAFARGVLRTGRLRLRGRTPSGYEFTSNPRIVWIVASSRATVMGRDVGEPGRMAHQATLGEFTIPQRGLFAVGGAAMTASAPAGGGR